MLLIIYRIFSFFALIPVFLYLVLKYHKNLNIKIFEFLSLSNQTLQHKDSIWLTASSMGEVSLVISILADLKEIPKNIIITTNDYESFHKISPYLGGNIYHFFLPLDNVLIIKKFINFINPSLFITIEREFFPEILINVNKFGAKLLIINGRLSNRSSNIYMRLHSIFSYLYSLYDAILVQYETDFKNYSKFTDKQKILITGSLKFIPPDIDIAPLLPQLDKPVICFGSIRDGEEKIIIKACQKILLEVDCIFILAPRYLWQLKNISKLLSDYQNISNFSEIKSNFLLLDSIGNLQSAYLSSNIAVVCGSLLKKYGGHNILEPIFLEKPTITGKYYRNFEKIIEILGNVVLITDKNNLSSDILELLKDPIKIKNLVDIPKSLIKNQFKSKDLTLETIKKFINKKL